MYRYENEQLFKINFAIFAVEALNNLDPQRYRLLYMEQKFQEIDGNNYSQQQQHQQKPSSNKLSPSNQFVSTLYIGFYKNNLYALPALIYNWQLTGITGPSEPVVQEIGPPPSVENNTNLIEAETSTDQNNAISIGHHKLPDRFDPPPNYIQPNDKLIVISANKHDEDNFVSSLEEIFGTFTNKQPLCPVETKSTKSKSKIVNIGSTLWKKFDDLMQNKYLWTIFTVLLGSIPPLAKAYYDRRRRVRLIVFVLVVYFNA
jgi:hypothetical protein